MSPFNHGVGDDAGHYGPDEADAQDDDDLMALRAMVGDKGLEALDFRVFIFRGGQGELFAVGGGGEHFSHGWLRFSGVCRSTGIRSYTILFRS